MKGSAGQWLALPWFSLRLRQWRDGARAVPPPLSWRGIAPGFCILAAAFALSGWLLFSPPAALLSIKGSLSGVGTVLALMLVLLGWRFPRALKAAPPLLAGLASVYFSLPLLDNWRGLSGEWGLLMPLSDSSNYYLGAMRLIDVGSLDFWCLRRPLAAAFAAVRLWLAGGDLRVALAINAGLVALAVLFAAGQISRRFGVAAAMVFVIVCHAFADPFLPTLLSENTGIFFGALAIGFLWRGMEEKSPGLSGAGMFFLALGLLARAGPFFLLPALLLWAFLYHRGSRRETLSWLGAMLAGLVLAFAVNILFLRVFGSGEVVANGNFSQILYGMAKGGASWTQLAIDHPELGMDAPENVRAAYRLAFGMLKDNPLPFLKFLLGELGHAPEYVVGLVPEYLAPLFVAGVVLALSSFRDRKSAFLLLGLLGVLVSAPFLRQEGGQRVFAAAIPFLAMFPCLAFHLVFPMVPGGANMEKREAPARRNLLLPLLAVAVLAMTLSPLAFIGGLHTAEGIETSPCPSGLRPVPFNTLTGMTMRVHEGATSSASYAPDIGPRMYDASLRRMSVFGGMAELAPPMTLMTYYERGGGGIGFAFLEGALWEPLPGRRHALCTETVLAENGRGVLRIRSIADIP